MKALVFNGQVVQVESVAFEVHSDWVWVDCPDEVTQGYSFDGNVFAPPASSPEPSYVEKRVREYPPMTDYLDGVVKGDQVQINKYIADCQAVKAKYPKT